MSEENIDTGLSFMFMAAREKKMQSICIGGSSSSSPSNSMPQIKLNITAIDDQPGSFQSGQYVWPAAETLANYLHEKWTDLWLRREDESEKLVVELGAGVGVAGLTCALLLQTLKEPGKVILTDYDPGCLEMIEKNISLNDIYNAHVENCEWGPDQELTLYPGCCDLLLGSDLIYCKSVVRPLLRTVQALLKAGGMFILVSSFDIHKESNIEFECGCDELGLEVEEAVQLQYPNIHRIQILKKKKV
jgi:predicted nicotinamide N-methyase